MSLIESSFAAIESGLTSPRTEEFQQAPDCEHNFQGQMSPPESGHKAEPLSWAQFVAEVATSIREYQRQAFAR